MAGRPPEKVAFPAYEKTSGGDIMKTTKPVKKTGKLTSTKIEKKAPLVRIA